MHYFDRYRQMMRACLDAVEATTRSGRNLGPAAGFDRWLRLSRKVQRAGGAHYFIGNGASATMASHMALDCAKNAGLRASAFNDTASLTALGNDLGYDHVFAAPLRWHGQKGDLLVAISSSGRSPNILAGIAAARERGLAVVTLTGMRPDNPARGLGDVNFYVPARTYGAVECTHQVLLHCWLDDFMGPAGISPAAP
jgi:D-sedoheptulose 7-phosphate isomerase